jgi:GPI-anchor transamidase subunit U
LELLNAKALAQIAHSGEAVSSRLFTSSRKDNRLDGTTIMIAYLLNPFTIAACLGRSTSAFTNAAIIHAVSNAVTGNAFRAMFALALASYLSMYPILLFPPLALLCWDQATRATSGKVSPVNLGMNLTATFCACLNGFLWLSYMVTGGSWEFLSATYGFQLSVPDLTPNVGLWWYFFIEIFDSFREFFLGVFWLHLAGYVGGLTLRVRRQPLFVITSLLGLFTIFKPYPSISDVSLYLAFVPLYSHVFPRKSFDALVSGDTNHCSHAIYLLRRLGVALCLSARPGILPSLDICRFWECKLLLCHYPGLESGVDTAGR